jgi:hypothetical protein
MLSLQPHHSVAIDARQLSERAGSSRLHRTAKAEVVGIVFGGIVVLRSEKGVGSLFGRLWNTHTEILSKAWLPDSADSEPRK